MSFKAETAALAALIAWLPAAPAAAQDQGIEVQELGAVDPFQVGVLDDVLPGDVWASSDARSLRALLEALPASDGQGWSSPIAARLAARALLSSGEPPRDGENDFELAALRADRALAAGRAEPVFELLDRTPRVGESAALARVHAETAFALGETGAACRTADGLEEARNAAYWLQARAACLAMDGDIRAAELTYEFALDAEPRSPAFEALFDAIALERELPGGVRPTSGLELAMAAFLDDQAEMRPADDAPVWLKRAAERTGPPIDLSDNPSEALEQAMGMDGAERAAALAALIGQDADREIAAEALAVRLDDAALESRFVETARGYAPEIARLPITAETLAHGPRFVLALALAGDMEAAWEWREALTEGPPRVRPSEFDYGFEDDDPGAPAGLAPPPDSFDEDAADWPEPDTRTLVMLDLALAIPRGDLTSLQFQTLLAERLENAGRRELAEAAALGALGATLSGEARAALTELEPEGEPVRAAPALLAGGAEAVAEAQLQAARLIERHGADPDAYALAAAAMAAAGLRDEALRFILETVAEDGAGAGA